MGYFADWLSTHPHTSVVRLTTLAHHFTRDSDESGQDKYRDWLGCTDTVSVEALEDFARVYGYRLRPEDFVDQGYYNATYRVPSRHDPDWMDFIHAFVAKYGGALVEQIHGTGKKAATFWASRKAALLKRWFVVANSADSLQSTLLYDASGEAHPLDLPPHACWWYPIADETYTI